MVLHRRANALFLHFIALTVWSCAAYGASPDSPSLDDEQYFETHIRPLFVERCQDCHAGSEAEGALRLDSRTGLMRGGNRGPAIIPGKPQQSLLLHAVSHGEELQMPPKEKLPPIAIARISEWITRGAPWPGNLPPEDDHVQAARTTTFRLTDEDRRFWSFTPITAAVLPQVEDTSWCDQPVDRFILAQLDAQGIQPASTVDRRKLIRRVSLTLTGLLPSAAEVRNFVDDGSPDAYVRLVDRLLASPQYGGHWGRHWLDVMRYADSNGMDENLAYAHAFRYRDYVIRSFNRDKPYAVFVAEQVAGDLLPDQQDESEQDRLDRQLATAVYAIGPKMLADDDPRKKELDSIDELIRTFGRGFLGLTLDCARCHDHKFDPISTHDYYALAGVFKSTKLMKSFGSLKEVVATWHLHTVATQEEYAAHDQHQRLIAAARQKIVDTIAAENRELQAVAQKMANVYLDTASPQVALNGSVAVSGQLSVGDHVMAARITTPHVLREAEDFDRGTIFQSKEGYGKDIGIISREGDGNYVEYDITVPAAGKYQLELRYATDQLRVIRLLVNGILKSENSATATTGGYHPQHQRWNLAGVIDLSEGTNLIRLEEVGPHLDKILIIPFNRSHDSRIDSLNPAFLHQWITFLQQKADSPDPPWQEWRRQEQARRNGSDEPDGRHLDWWNKLASGDSGGQVAQRLGALLDSEDGPCRIPDDLEQYHRKPTLKRLDEQRKQAAALEKSLPTLPQAMGVVEGTVETLRVHHRGSYLSLGPEAPRGFPEILRTPTTQPVPETESGRLQLARWLTDPHHPLTARVIANRIWGWHFGRGIVSTSSNFGRLGMPPSHPRLLDYLAHRLVCSGWSIKALNREILLSRTYRMSGDYDRDSHEKDPDNRWLWRFPRRRMTAEQIRDGMLTVSQQIDLAIAGQLLNFGDHTYVTFSRDNRGPDMFRSRRRTVYLPVVRSALYEAIQAFDFPDPSMTVGNRNTTTVAPQALVMMNSELANSQTEATAKSLLQHESWSDSMRVQEAYLRAFSRPPTALESEQAVAFVQRIQDAYASEQTEQPLLRAWQSLCRVLISSNEFIYIQ